MIIPGKQIASEIKVKLKKQVSSLKSQNITPHLAVVLVGDDPSSQTYVHQKEKIGAEIGAKVTVYILLEDTPVTQDTSEVARLVRRSLGEGGRDSSDGGENKKKLVELVQSLNSNPKVHGIIIQRPVPLDIPSSQLDQLVQLDKDIDSFHPQSPFTPPIALAVLKILEFCRGSDPLKGPTLFNWLSTKRILIIGRGETGGKPITETFQKLNIPFQVAHSKTPENELKNLCLSSDIIISAVGKPNILRHDMVTKNTILIGVGLHPTGDTSSHPAGRRLEPDYNEQDIADKVAFYTPVPGGVGPVNVACLFENLLKAVELQK